MENVLITGANGLVASRLRVLLSEKGYNVRTLTTHNAANKAENVYFWNPKRRSIDLQAFENLDYIIHLAGANIGEKRWTTERKALLADSRIQSAEFLFQSVQKSNCQLKAYITASATGYYGAITSTEVKKEEMKPASDFLGNLCREWEAKADLFQNQGIRTVKIRTGVVLAKNSEALNKMLLPVKMYVGSPIGSGHQCMPWIHIDDLCGIYIKALGDNHMQGAYNAVAPEIHTNKSFTKSLAEVWNRPFVFPPVPSIMLQLLLGDMACIVTQGSPVSADKIIKSGYQFEFPNLKQALQQIKEK